MPIAQPGVAAEYFANTASTLLTSRAVGAADWAGRSAGIAASARPMSTRFMPAILVPDPGSDPGPDPGSDPGPDPGPDTASDPGSVLSGQFLQGAGRMAS